MQPGNRDQHHAADRHESPSIRQRRLDGEALAAQQKSYERRVVMRQEELQTTVNRLYYGSSVALRVGELRAALPASYERQFEEEKRRAELQRGTLLTRYVAALDAHEQICVRPVVETAAAAATAAVPHRNSTAAVASVYGEDLERLAYLQQLRAGQVPKPKGGSSPPRSTSPGKREKTQKRRQKGPDAAERVAMSALNEQYASKPNPLLFGFTLDTLHHASSSSPVKNSAAAPASTARTLDASRDGVASPPSLQQSSGSPKPAISFDSKQHLDNVLGIYARANDETMLLVTGTNVPQRGGEHHRTLAKRFMSPAAADRYMPAPPPMHPGWMTRALNDRNSSPQNVSAASAAAATAADGNNDRTVSPPRGGQNPVFGRLTRPKRSVNFGHSHMAVKTLEEIVGELPDKPDQADAPAKPERRAKPAAGSSKNTNSTRSGARVSPQRRRPDAGNNRSSVLPASVAPAEAVFDLATDAPTAPIATATRQPDYFYAATEPAEKQQQPKRQPSPPQDRESVHVATVVAESDAAAVVSPKVAQQPPADEPAGQGNAGRTAPAPASPASASAPARAPAAAPEQRDVPALPASISRMLGKRVTAFHGAQPAPRAARPAAALPAAPFKPAFGADPGRRHPHPPDAVAAAVSAAARRQSVTALSSASVFMTEDERRMLHEHEQATARAAAEEDALATMNGPAGRDGEAAAWARLMDQQRYEAEMIEYRRKEREFVVRRQQKARDHIINDETSYRREGWKRESTAWTAIVRKFLQEQEMEMRDALFDGWQAGLVLCVNEMNLERRRAERGAGRPSSAEEAALRTARAQREAAAAAERATLDADKAARIAAQQRAQDEQERAVMAAALQQAGADAARRRVDVLIDAEADTRSHFTALERREFVDSVALLTRALLEQLDAWQKQRRAAVGVEERDQRAELARRLVDDKPKPGSAARSAGGSSVFSLGDGGDDDVEELDDPAGTKPFGTTTSTRDSKKPSSAKSTGSDWQVVPATGPGDSSPDRQQQQLPRPRSRPRSGVTSDESSAGMTPDEAALKIQSVQRGRIARREFHRVRRAKTADATKHNAASGDGAAHVLIADATAPTPEPVAEPASHDGKQEDANTGAATASADPRSKSPSQPAAADAAAASTMEPAAPPQPVDESKKQDEHHDEHRDGQTQGEQHKQQQHDQEAAEEGELALLQIDILRKLFGTKDLSSVANRPFAILPLVSSELQLAPVHYDDDDEYVVQQMEELRRIASASSSSRHRHKKIRRPDDNIEAVERDDPVPPPVYFAITEERCLRIFADPHAAFAWRFNGVGKPVSCSKMSHEARASAYSPSFDFQPVLLSNGSFSLSVPGLDAVMEAQLDAEIPVVSVVARQDATNFSEFRLEYVGGDDEGKHMFMLDRPPSSPRPSTSSRPQSNVQQQRPQKQQQDDSAHPSPSGSLRPHLSPEDAATRIQSLQRGRIARRQRQELERSRHASASFSDRTASASASVLAAPAVPATPVRTGSRGGGSGGGSRPDTAMSPDQAALKIQALQRGRIARRDYHRARRAKTAAAAAAASSTKDDPLVPQRSRLSAQEDAVRRDILHKLFATDDLLTVAGQPFLVTPQVAEDLHFAAVRDDDDDDGGADANGASSRRAPRDYTIEAVERGAEDAAAAPPPPVYFEITEERCVRVFVDRAAAFVWRFNGVGKPVSCSKMPRAARGSAFDPQFDFQPVLLSNGAFSLAVPGHDALLEGQLDADAPVLLAVPRQQATNFSEFRLEFIAAPPAVAMPAQAAAAAAAAATPPASVPPPPAVAGAVAAAASAPLPVARPSSAPVAPAPAAAAAAPASAQPAPTDAPAPKAATPEPAAAAKAATPEPEAAAAGAQEAELPSPVQRPQRPSGVDVPPKMDDSMDFGSPGGAQPGEMQQRQQQRQKDSDDDEDIEELDEPVVATTVTGAEPPPPSTAVATSVAATAAAASSDAHEVASDHATMASEHHSAAATSNNTNSNVLGQSATQMSTHTGGSDINNLADVTEVLQRITEQGVAAKEAAAWVDAEAKRRMEELQQQQQQLVESREASGVLGPDSKPSSGAYLSAAGANSAAGTSSGGFSSSRASTHRQSGGGGGGGGNSATTSNAGNKHDSSAGTSAATSRNASRRNLLAGTAGGAGGAGGGVANASPSLRPPSPSSPEFDAHSSAVQQTELHAAQAVLLGLAAEDAAALDAEQEDDPEERSVRQSSMTRAEIDEDNRARAEERRRLRQAREERSRQRAQAVAILAAGGITVDDALLASSPPPPSAAQQPRQQPPQQQQPQQEQEQQQQPPPPRDAMAESLPRLAPATLEVSANSESQQSARGRSAGSSASVPTQTPSVVPRSDTHQQQQQPQQPLTPGEVLWNPLPTEAPLPDDAAQRLRRQNSLDVSSMGANSDSPETASSLQLRSQQQQQPKRAGRAASLVSSSSTGAELDPVDDAAFAEALSKSVRNAAGAAAAHRDDGITPMNAYLEPPVDGAPQQRPSTDSKKAVLTLTPEAGSLELTRDTLAATTNTGDGMSSSASVAAARAAMTQHLALTPGQPDITPPLHANPLGLDTASSAAMDFTPEAGGAPPLVLHADPKPPAQSDSRLSFVHDEHHDDDDAAPPPVAVAAVPAPTVDESALKRRPTGVFIADFDHDERTKLVDIMKEDPDAVLDVTAGAPAPAAVDDATAEGGGAGAAAGNRFADGRRQTLIDVLAARGDGKASSDDEL